MIWLLGLLLATSPVNAVPAAPAVAGTPVPQTAAAGKGFDYGRYVPSTLAHAEEASCAGDRPATTLDLTLAPVRLDAIATRKLRPLADDASGLLDRRERMTGQKLPAYTQEVLVRIDGQERWLLIQPQLVPYWLDEVTDERPATLYVVRVGCHRAELAAADRLVFSINEFEIAPPGPTETNQ
ncbi:MAG: hypothetical protein ACREO3_10495 [Arenimonas sp.]